MIGNADEKLETTSTTKDNGQLIYVLQCLKEEQTMGSSPVAHRGIPGFSLVQVSIVQVPI
jgi:hypothetical protein